MGCVQSNVKPIRVVQQAGEKRRPSCITGSALRAARTPLPNLVDDEPELSRLPKDSELGESGDWRNTRSGGQRQAGSSPDSGVFELMSGVITESSAPELVQNVQRDFRSPDSCIELVVTGQACQRRISSIRTEEAAILQLLRQEGLLAKDGNTASGGLSYDLIDEKSATTSVEGTRHGPGPKLPPIRLEKLERRRARHRDQARFSEQQISEKLEKAEERRREVEQEKMRRLAERISSARTSEVRQLEQLTRMQKSMDKFENTIENREQRLASMREKLRQHHEHAAVIRLRRSMASLEDSDLSRGNTPDDGIGLSTSINNENNNN